MQKLKYIIFLVLVVYGCSTSRKGNYSSVNLGTPPSIYKREITGRNITNYNFFIQKAEIEISNEEASTDLVASMKYQKEGKYLISIRSKSGIEVVRIFLTKDTILANDRIHKKIYYGSASYLENKYGISFRSLPVIFGDFIDVDDKGKEIINCRDGKGIFSYFFGEKALTMDIDCKIRKPFKSEIKSESDDSMLEIEYEDFNKNENFIYPKEIHIIESKTRSDIRIEIKKIIFNTEEKMVFIPGSNYEYILLK